VSFPGKASQAPPTVSLASEARLGPVLARLAGRRPLFHSERDFQHELANELGSIDSVYARVDQPVQFGPGRIKLDILATSYRGGRKRTGFELKYLPRKLAWTDRTTGEEYSLRELPPLERLGFLLDIGRLERAVRLGAIDAGCALLLSNDPSLWFPREFHRYDAWVLELLSAFEEDGTLALAKLQSQSSDGFWWGLRVGGLALSESWDESTIQKDPAARQQAFDAFRRLPYIFEGEYPARWRPYSVLDSSVRGTFRYLAIEVS
jgi:hypothetical protein